MKTILVVDDDKLILRLAKEALKDYHLRTAENGREALEILRRSPPDLVLTDLNMPVMDGFELISFLNRRQQDIPIIVMTGFGSSEIARQLKQKGVHHYIEKPFEINLLRNKIAEVLQARSKGFIHGFTLANFLQAVEVEQKTVTLRVISNRQVGYLHIKNGELINADTENFKGEKAAIDILCWDDPEIEMQGLRTREQIIRVSLMQILLWASTRQDEKQDGSSTLDDLMDEAVWLIKGHHFKRAQKQLAAFLKKNPRNPRAWLWYSRIIINPKSIESALKNAKHLAPKDPEILEEIQKLEIVKASLQNGSVRRCPFCWTATGLKVSRCPYCRSALSISGDLFAGKKTPKKEILEKAVERYTKVIASEKNLNAHYYMSLAQLNLGRWEEGLNLFHKTVNLAPEKKGLEKQLRILLNHMASEEPACPGPGEPARPAMIVPGERDQKKKILVVEDSPTTRKVISITLGQKGYEIIEARDGLEALSRLSEAPPDLILLDIVLPKMDGYKILEIIRKNNLFRHIPVIMLTSKDSMISKWKGRLAGSTAYLTKPFDPKKLVTTIEKHL